ncbi:sensor histidine kinase [Solilutibacter silvestris]|uniref:sensor histidine kinase n=1 Tax=Solilutibacter silvestris TaxID=1645665 RepID=UPI003D328A93
MDSNSPAIPMVPPSWRVAWLAAVPVALCLLVMALPTLGHSQALAYRALYLVANALWVPALVVMQRWLWRNSVALWPSILALLAATYAMSLANSALGVALALVMGLPIPMPFPWWQLLSGLDGCWLALIAFCAAHAMIGHYAALKEEQRRLGQAELAAREAELRALRYQLHPHFLFNALNGVSALVAEKRDDDARTMIAQLGTFLRATLDGHSHEVPLAEELALTETYLSIEKARLGERLQLQWNVGAGVLDAIVPALLLQPLVENAIRHGIARRSTPGRIGIDIAARGDRLSLQVRNDGADVVMEDSREGDALGQSNVRERLARLYPERHHFSAMETASGYKVTIEIPLLRPVVAPVAA